MAAPAPPVMTGTLQGATVNTFEEAQRVREQELFAQMASELAASQGQATQAGQAFQEQAAAPPPQLSAWGQLLPTLLGNVASIIGQQPAYREEAQEGLQTQKKELMLRRVQTLKALETRYESLADAARQLGNKQAEQKALMDRDKTQREHQRILKEMEVTRADTRQAAATAAQERIAAARNQATIDAAKFRGQGGAAAGTQGREDAVAIAEAIEKGDQPPVMTGLYRLAGPVRAELAQRGYNLSTAQKDWEATKKHFASLNSTQQQRLRQAAQTAFDSMDIIDDLSTQLSAKLPRNRFPVFNRAAMIAAKQGLAGLEAQDLARQLDVQITDVISELGQVYRGGYAPTNEALKLAEKNLSGDWSDRTIKVATKLARSNLRIRLNSIIQTEAVTPSSQEAARTSAGPKATHRWDPATGKIVPIGP